MNPLVMTALASGSTTLGLTAGFLSARVHGVRRELVEVRQELEAARRAARVDALTGLPNRVGLLEELGQRVSGGEPFAVLLVDLDGFKAVNDTYGHGAGDVVLADVAERLSALVAGAGMAARLGGDEFVVVASAAAPVLARLLGYDVVRAVAEPVDVAGQLIEVRASVGVVLALPGDDVRALLRSADIAMYQAKRGLGQAGVVEFDAVLGLAGVVEERPGARLRELTRLGLDLAEVRS